MLAIYQITMKYAVYQLQVKWKFKCDFCLVKITYRVIFA